MSQARHKARRVAVQALYSWQMNNQPTQNIEDHFVAEHDMKGVDVNYFQELINQVPAHQKELDEQMSPFLDRAINSVDPVERAILRMGVYELQYRLDVPYRVVINEGVELAKVFGGEQGHKYVNSILDGVARKLRSVEMAAKANSQ